AVDVSAFRRHGPAVGEGPVGAHHAAVRAGIGRAVRGGFAEAKGRGAAAGSGTGADCQAARAVPLPGANHQPTGRAGARGHSRGECPRPGTETSKPVLEQEIHAPTAIVILASRRPASMLVKCSESFASLSFAPAAHPASPSARAWLGKAGVRLDVAQVHDLR